jgi:hypothetical protein
MVPDGDKPLVGNTATTLGVRLPPDPRPDLPVNADGTVDPGTGGMSVAPAWRLLPVWRIPRRLGTRFLGAKGVQGASGSNQLVCWRTGAGPFTESFVTPGLFFRPEPAGSAHHGVVEPAIPMPVTVYQAALAATRDQWEKDEA